MREVYLYLMIISYVLAGAFLITSVVLWFKLNIRSIIKDKGDTLGQKQMEEIRAKNMGAAQHKGKVNVFEELEKRAKPRTSNIGSLKIGTTAGDSGPIRPRTIDTASGTTVLQQPAKTMNPDFIIEKNIVFVSTSEVI